jgi:ABC-type enterochelin transport system permease subunit
MRRILIITLLLGGIFVSFVSVMSKTVTRNETDVTNNQIYSGMTGLHVSLPSDMKNFPVELVPQP